MKCEKLNQTQKPLVKAQMARVKGGISTTEFKQVSAMEQEWEVNDKGERIGDKPILVDMPL